jgi:hypothetical protein
VQNGNSTVRVIFQIFHTKVSIDSLKSTKDLKVDYCPKCEKNVYLTTTKEELIENLSLKRCIIWDENNTLLQERKEFKESSKGFLKPEKDIAIYGDNVISQ